MKSRAVMFDANYKLTADKAVNPYVVGSLGMAKLSSNEIEEMKSSNHKKSSFAYAVGAGVDIPVNKSFSIDISAKYFDHGKVGGAKFHGVKSTAGIVMKL